MEPSLDIPLEMMNLTGQQQPSSVPDVSINDEFDKLLANFAMYPDNTCAAVSTTFADSNNDDEHFDINALINSSDEPTDPVSYIESQLSETSIDDNDILNLLESYTSNDPSQQSTFIEQYETSSFSQSQQGESPTPPSVPIGSSPVEPKANDTLFAAQAFVDRQDQFYRAASKSKRSRTHQHRSTTVGPVDYYLHSGGCQPCTTQVQNDFVYQQQTLQYDATESKQIPILSQPRSKFRPRTQNESKISSHYLRCEEGVKPEYPTTAIPSSWAFQSDVNLVEVTLVGIDKQPHPYAIDNKTSSDTFEDHALIFKQNEPNTLYFRLTNEDYQNGYKTFMLELIKGKQDHVITKELIRARQLEHSMLRFTRLFQIRKGEFQRDEGSEQYSSIMSEAYGDVDVEHMGPRYGPMVGQEMVYMVLKGRIVKSDLKIEILEPFTRWSYSVDDFTKNGQVVYFRMPAFPYPQFETMKANIVIYYKGEELSQNSYLYKGSLDQELAELRLNDACTTTTSAAMTNTFNPLDFFSSTGVPPKPASRKSTTSKGTKRLNNKQK